MTERERKIRERLSSILVDVSFRPMERKILQVLADGERHKSLDMVSILGDSQATLENLQLHISNIRPKIVRFGHAIICEFANRQKFYRYVILLETLIE